MFPRQTAVADLRHPEERGVCSVPFGTGRVYFTVTSDGIRGSWRIPIGTETADDVIEALADELDATDPLPRSASVRRPASAVAARARHLHRVW
jgi:hypothetical protein